jgi:hypothetical protein
MARVVWRVRMKEIGIGLSVLAALFALEILYRMERRVKAWLAQKTRAGRGQ